MVSKFEHCIRACQSGVNRVHVIDGRIDEALLAEVFSNEGIGTMIYANEYQAVRRAMKKDVRAIRNLIRESVEQEEIVKRSRADIISQLQDYYVFQIDGNIVGCVALHIQPGGETAELRAFPSAARTRTSALGRS